MKPEILLKAYVLHQSEDAFRDLVAGSMDEVYSTALKIVEGASHLAEETALRVYWRLARRAPRLGEGVTLASWLRQHTCKTAVIVLRENDRSVSRSALKREMRATSTANGVQPAPPALALRVCQGVLLNAARNKGFRQLWWPVQWPVWIRPVHIRAATLCALLIVILWNIPFHRVHPIVLSAGIQMTPASFAQLGSPDEENAPAVAASETKSKSN